MKLISDDGRQRIYQSEADPTTHYELRAEMALRFRLIERATYESHDPADKERVETVYKFLRMELAVHFADMDDVELVGEPVRQVGTGTPDVQPEPGLSVPSIALIVEQVYWPPAPTEIEETS